MDSINGVGRGGDEAEPEKTDASVFPHPHHGGGAWHTLKVQLSLDTFLMFSVTFPAGMQPPWDQSVFLFTSMSAEPRAVSAYTRRSINICRCNR